VQASCARCQHPKMRPGRFRAVAENWCWCRVRPPLNFAPIGAAIKVDRSSWDVCKTITFCTRLTGHLETLFSHQHPGLPICANTCTPREFAMIHARRTCALLLAGLLAGCEVGSESTSPGVSAAGGRQPASVPALAHSTVDQRIARGNLHF